MPGSMRIAAWKRHHPARGFIRPLCSKCRFPVKSQNLPAYRTSARSWSHRSRRHSGTGRRGSITPIMERDESRRLDSDGHVKSEDVDVSRTILVNGVPFEQLVERNGRPPSAEEERKQKEKLDKLKRETPEQRAERLRKQEEENTSIVREVPKAFDFQLVGEEVVNGRPAYVLQATPHPGYQAQGKYGKMFSKVEGKLWVDKQDLGWIKVDGQVIQPFSMGLFLVRAAARLAHYDGADARRRRDLDAGTRRGASGRENLLREESRDRSGPDLLGIQAAASRRATTTDPVIPEQALGPDAFNARDLCLARGVCSGCESFHDYHIPKRRPC